MVDPLKAQFVAGVVVHEVHHEFAVIRKIQPGYCLMAEGATHVETGWEHCPVQTTTRQRQDKIFPVEKPPGQQTPTWSAAPPAGLYPS